MTGVKGETNSEIGTMRSANARTILATDQKTAKKGSEIVDQKILGNLSDVI